MPADRRFLITGAGGRIGARLAERFVSRHPGTLVMGRSASPQSLGWDFTEPEPTAAVRDAIRDATDLVHLASIVDDTPPLGERARKMVAVNLQGTIHLLAHLPKLSHVTFVSSVAVYGPPHVLPCTEEHPTRPTQLYGVLKLATENLLRLHARRTDMTVSVLRVSSVWGFPDQTLSRGGAISTFLRAFCERKPVRLVRTARLLRDYVHVNDVVGAIGTSAERRASGVFNIASGEGHSLVDVATTAAQVAGCAPEFEWDESLEPASDFVTDITYDIRRATEALDYRPAISLIEGLRVLRDQYATP